MLEIFRGVRRVSLDFRGVASWPKEAQRNGEFSRSVPPLRLRHLRNSGRKTQAANLLPLRPAAHAPDFQASQYHRKGSVRSS